MVLPIPSPNTPQFACKIGDAAHLAEFPDNCFETVVDSFGLCSYDDPVAVLREVKRVCRAQGGKIVLLEHGRVEIPSVIDAVFGYECRTACPKLGLCVESGVGSHYCREWFSCGYPPYVPFWDVVLCRLSVSAARRLLRIGSILNNTSRIANNKAIPANMMLQQ